MKKNKKILFSFIVTILLIFVVVIILLIPKTEKISKSEWDSILLDFDNLDSYTYQTVSTIVCSSKEGIKITEDYQTIYFEYQEEETYRYYSKNDSWFREKYYNEIPIKLSFDFYLFKESYQKFKNDNQKYRANNLKINDIIYEYVIFTIEDGQIKQWTYKINGVESIVYFYNQNSTKIIFPEKYNIVYEQLNNDEWQKIVDESENITNFTLSATYNDVVNGEEYLKYAQLSKYDNKKLLIDNSGKDMSSLVYSVISNGILMNYENRNNQWVLSSTTQTELINYNQRQTLPLGLIKSNLDKLSFNAIGNIYILNNVSFDNCLYQSVIIKISNNFISYIELKYTYELDGVTHKVERNLNYSDINNTVVNVTID